MKPPRITPPSSISRGNPIGILRAEVINILNASAIMVKPLESGFKASTLIGFGTAKFKIGDMLTVIRTSQGSYKFIKIAEATEESAVPQTLEVDKTEIMQTTVPAVPPILPSLAPSVSSAANNVFPHLLENTTELLGQGKKLNRLVIQQPSAETKAKAEGWIVHAKEIIACYRTETSRGWTSNLVRIRSDLVNIAILIPKLLKLLKQGAQMFVIPVPGTISMDITEKVPAPKKTTPQVPDRKPVEAPIQKVVLERPNPLEFSPFVWTFIKAQRLLISSQFRTESLEEVRQLYDRIDHLLRGNNLDEALQEERKTYGTKPVKELYLEVFQEFSVKFYHYLNTKDIDPERLIGNKYRKVPLSDLLDACRYFDRDHLERGGLDYSEKEKVRDLEIWLNFILTDNNLTLEYPKLHNKPDELSNAISVFRKSLKVIDNYLK